ncbi:PREDICTED: uncharacterized protein LOC105562437 isoform X2 [Vollenhovia emeryi]|uniref:uncharacterized protein LOC105562437 isoform X2 n=1 Tax=Vollenhovia emeryi TaxID=411798 RepID=UPI0005F4F7B1|nr:PREDICTED: uncharacterized protein LOC105562437 isoform X2 [Vollenhovia emeryi]
MTETVRRGVYFSRGGILHLDQLIDESVAGPKYSRQSLGWITSYHVLKSTSKGTLLSGITDAFDLHRASDVRRQFPARGSISVCQLFCACGLIGR